MRKHCREIDDPRRLIDRASLHRGNLMLAQSLAHDLKSARQRRIAELPCAALPALRLDSWPSIKSKTTVPFADCGLAPTESSLNEQLYLAGRFSPETVLDFDAKEVRTRWQFGLGHVDAVAARKFP
jgi:hypothetical protein